MFIPLVSPIILTTPYYASAAWDGLLNIQELPIIGPLPTKLSAATPIRIPEFLAGRLCAARAIQGFHPDWSGQVGMNPDRVVRNHQPAPKKPPASSNLLRVPALPCTFTKLKGGGDASFSTRSSGSKITCIVPSRQRRLRQYRSGPSGRLLDLSLVHRTP